jgi:CBS-domain-containing membrane protein
MSQPLTNEEQWIAAKVAGLMSGVGAGVFTWFATHNILLDLAVALIVAPMVAVAVKMFLEQSNG